MLTTDLFLVSYPDHYWGLAPLFRSLAKFVTGFRRVVLVLEESDPAPDLPAGVSVVIHRCRNYRECHKVGYANYWGRGGQQIEKMRAWQYTDADRIVYVDSDMVFSRPVDLQTDPCISLEKPLLIWRHWKDAGDARCWYLGTKTILRMEPPGETMVRFPFVFPRWFVQEYWDQAGEEWLRVFAHPQDFNGLGNWALLKHPDAFTPVLLGKDNPPPGCIYSYSHLHRGPEVLAELGRLGVL